MTDLTSCTPAHCQKAGKDPFMAMSEKDRETCKLPLSLCKSQQPSIAQSVLLVGNATNKRVPHRLQDLQAFALRLQVFDHVAIAPGGLDKACLWH